MKHLDTIWKIVLLATLVLVAIGLVSICIPKYARLTEYQRRKLKYQATNAELNKQTDDIRTKREKFVSDPEYVKTTAREIGMLEPGEVVFKFTNDQARAPVAGATEERTR